jgi:hypothetical protein
VGGSVLPSEEIVPKLGVLVVTLAA